MNKQGAPSDLKSAITALRLRQLSPSLGEKKPVVWRTTQGKAFQPEPRTRGEEPEETTVVSEVRRALVFPPGLVHMLETVIPFHALFIFAENRKQLCRDGSRGPIRRSRTMTQGHGQCQRRVERLTQSKAEAVIKSMKDRNINEVSISLVGYTGACPSSWENPHLSALDPKPRGVMPWGSLGSTPLDLAPGVLIPGPGNS